MIDKTLARGLFLAAIALFFGLGALRFPVGTLSRAGPGFFPLVVSALLMLIALITIVRSRYVAHERLDLNPRNIAVILASLCAFALASHLVNMTVGIVAMVFISAFAGTGYSVLRNLKVSASLVAIAFAFHHFLGLNLNLW